MTCSIGINYEMPGAKDKLWVKRAYKKYSGINMVHIFSIKRTKKNHETYKMDSNWWQKALDFPQKALL